MNQFTASLWGDEAWAATLAIKPLTQIVQIVARDTAPPLYYILLHTWMQIFGTSEIAIRSLSFVFFLLTILTAFLIGKHLWDKKTGLWAAALTAVNPFLFQYAFEGRMYALLALTCTLSIYFFLVKNRVGFILATAAALYTHHFALFIVVFEGLFRLSEIKLSSVKNIFKGISDFLIVGLLYVPWLYPLYYQTSLVAGGFWLGKPNLKDIKELVFKFLSGSEMGLLRNLTLVSIAGTLLTRRWWTDQKKTLFLLGWFVVPILITYLLSQKFQSIFYDRYMLMTIPAAMVLLASLRQKITFIPILVMIAILAYVDYTYFFHPIKRPFRDLANYVKQEAPNLPRFNYNASAHHLFESKYYGIHAPIYAATPLPFYTGTALMEKGDIIEKLPEGKEILAITSESPEKVDLPGWKVTKYKQFESLAAIWLVKVK